MTSYKRIASLKTADQFSDRLHELNVSLPFDRDIHTGDDGPLHQSIQWEQHRIGNRFAFSQWKDGMERLMVSPAN